MEALIKLSETKDFIFYCVVVPKDATQIEKFIEVKCGLFWNIPYGCDFIYLEKDFKLMGILGEDLTEDQAKEMVQTLCDYKGSCIHKNYLTGGCLESALESLQSLIESKGVKLTNPLGEKPNMKDIEYSPLYFNHEFSQQCYKEDLKEWEQAERELKKCVIIKTKK